MEEKQGFGFIIEINKTREIPHANTLKIAEIFHRDVLVHKSFEIGDKCVYFASDSVLDRDFCKKNKLLREDGGYVHDNCRIKAINLLGTKSDGLILPIDVLSDYIDVNDLKVGDIIDTLGGVAICKKYIPGGKKNKNTRPMQKKKHRVKYLFPEHKDTSQLRYNLGNIKEGDEIVITEKIHATSGRSGYVLKRTNRSNFLSRLFRIHLSPKEEYEYIMGSRRVNIPLSKVNDKEGFHGGNEFRLKAHNNFTDKLHKQEIVYYEIIGFDDNGKPIMPIVNNAKLKDKEFIKKYGDSTHFRYGLNSGNDVYVYRITTINPDGIEIDYSWDQVKYRCEQMGVKCVPELDRFYFDNTDNLINKIDELVEGPSTIDQTHIREGVVVRINNKPFFSAYKDKSVNFKILEGIIKDSGIPDIEEAEEAFVTEE